MKRVVSEKKSAVKRAGICLNLLCVAFAVLVLYVVISFNTDNTLFGKTYYVTENFVDGLTKGVVVNTTEVDTSALSVGDTIAFNMDIDDDKEKEVITRNVYAVSVDADGKTIIRTQAD